MIFFSKNALSAVPLALSLLLVAPSAGLPQSVVSAGEDRITIDAEAVSLETFFQEFSKVVPVELLMIAPDLKQVAVSLRLAEVPPALGVHKLLQKAEVDYAVSGGDGKPFRIIVGALGDRKLTALAEGEPISDEAGIEPPEDPPGYGAEEPMEGASPGEPGGEFRGTRRNRPGTYSGIAGAGVAAGAGGTAERDAGSPGGFPSESTGDESFESPEPDRPSSRPNPRRPSTVSGMGFIVSGSAALTGGPASPRLAATGGVLALGLSLGLLLVRRPEE